MPLLSAEIVYYPTSLTSRKAIDIMSSGVLIPTNVLYSVVELSSTSGITSPMAACP